MAEASSKKSKKHHKDDFDDIEYESHHPGRAPIALPTEPTQPIHHPFLSTNSPQDPEPPQYNVELSHQSDIIQGQPLEGNTNSNNVVMLTGTIKRGKKDSEVVHLQLTPEELEKMSKSTMTMDDTDEGSHCGCRKGPHILLLSLLFIPFAFLSSFCVCFYVGTMCWYNIYLYLSEEKSIAHRVLLCPVLILFYPVIIMLFTVALSLYSAVVQVSWILSSWLRQIRDFDKGFYGWLCGKLGVPQCAPYEVVIVDDSAFNMHKSTDQINAV